MRSKVVPVFENSVARRTRFQKALIDNGLRRQGINARLETRHKKKQKLGITIDETTPISDEDEPAVTVVSEDEFLKWMSESQDISIDIIDTPPMIIDVEQPIDIAHPAPMIEGIVEVNDDGNDNNNTTGNNCNANDDGNNISNNDNVNVDEDEDSDCQYIGEKWNSFSDYEDDIYIGGNDGYDDVNVVSVGAGVGVGFGDGGGGGESQSLVQSDEMDGTSSENDEKIDDRDFKVDETGNYSSSVYSSSDEEFGDEDDDADDDEGDDFVSEDDEEFCVDVSKKRVDVAKKRFDVDFIDLVRDNGKGTGKNNKKKKRGFDEDVDLVRKNVKETVRNNKKKEMVFDEDVVRKVVHEIMACKAKEIATANDEVRVDNVGRNNVIGDSVKKNMEIARNKKRKERSFDENVVERAEIDEGVVERAVFDEGVVERAVFDVGVVERAVFDGVLDDVAKKDDNDNDNDKIKNNNYNNNEQNKMNNNTENKNISNVNKNVNTTTNYIDIDNEEDEEEYPATRVQVVQALATVSCYHKRRFLRKGSIPEQAIQKRPNEGLVSTGIAEKIAKNADPGEGQVRPINKPEPVKKKLIVGSSSNSVSNKDDENKSWGDERQELPEQNERWGLLQSKAKSNRKRKLRANELQQNLLSTIVENENEGLEYTAPPAAKEVFYLPLKFSFPPKKEEPEKTEDELEEESLFKELDLCLQACDIGVDVPSVKDEEKAAETTDTESKHRFCGKGKHHLIHDEEIGIVCKICAYVLLESRYVTDDFHENIFGRTNTREYGMLPREDKIGGQFDLPGSISGGQGEPEPITYTQGTVWELIPGIWSTLYPHQREGFEFIWRNVAGGIKMEELGQPTKFGIGGCIICHAPGTGKTRLAMVFIQSFMKKYPMSRPVIVAPRTMLRTWQEEVVRWKIDVPFFNLNEDELTGREDPETLKSVGKFRHRKTIRAMKLYTWAKGKGILGISYGLYEKLAGDKKDTDQKFREALLKQPGIIFLDEGHTPRNDKSNIWKVLSEVSTKRKVILSGTPFQNNFEELSNTISLVREEFGIPLMSGHHAQDERRIEELRNKIRPFVHVHKGEILKQTLQGLFASLIELKPSQLQKMCFAAVARSNQANFGLDNSVSVASVHPSIFCEQKPSFIGKDLMGRLQEHRQNLDAGVKTRFLVELIRLSQGERVLVFGQFLPPLNFLAGLLKKRFDWTMGRELLYMDGQQDARERQTTIRIFNDTRSEAKVLLASTKACCEGIHLVGASRVVLLDVVWNPSVERQAISRAYRLGQKKDVYVYHLITSGTLEEQKYKRQASKERLSELVFCSAEGEKETIGSKIVVDQVLEAMLNNEKMKTMFQKIVYQPKADNLIENFVNL